jgi:hypothetical protein
LCRGNAITINAGPTDEVQLRGLTIDGSGTGANGIVLNSGAGITVTNCVVQNFAPAIGNGILLQPTSGLSFIITNTLLSRNGAFGLYYHPTSGTPVAYGVIDHVIATDNNSGIVIDPSLATGGSTTVAISDSIASNNPGSGINAIGVTVSIVGSKISGNGVGVNVGSFQSSSYLGSSTITGNTIGVNNPPKSGVSGPAPPITFPLFILSWGDNHINGNGTDFNGDIPSVVGLH